MSSREWHGIPEFLKDQTVYYDYTNHSQSGKTWLVLTRNLKFYLFQRKQLKRSIDLGETFLSKDLQRLRDYQGPKCRWCKSRRQAQGDTTAPSTSAAALTLRTSALLNESTLQPDTLPSEINFGKYVHVNFSKTITLYYLLRCWDKLLVLQNVRSANDEAVFKVTAEWERVSSYKLVHDKIKYQAAIEITFVNGTKHCTNFNESNEPPTPKTLLLASVQDRNIKALFERVRSAKCELQLHRTTTQKEFEEARDMLAFGRNLFRSLKLEEKQMLSRCGDIWMRFVAAADALVIGVPLVNNCSAPNLTIMRDLRAVLKFNAPKRLVGITYEQHIYKLQQRFENLETLETFFQSVADGDDDEDDNEKQSKCTSIWTRGSQQQMLPESFAVLVLKLPISQLIALGDSSNPLFLLFEIEKELDLGTGTRTKIYQHQIFLQNFNFSDILARRQTYEVTFKPQTLHQDFLAIASACAEIKLLIKFVSANDLAKFEQLLVEKFDCEMLKRGDDNDKAEDEECGSGNSFDNSLPKGNLDSEHTPRNSAQHFRHSVFFNRKPTSMWHGLLVLRIATAPDTTALVEDATHWKLYAPSAERSLLLVKLLQQDLILFGCNVVQFTHSTSHNVVTRTADNSVKVLEFEHAMRLELSTLLQLVTNKSEDSKMEYDVFAKLQMHTDLLAMALE